MIVALRRFTIQMVQALFFLVIYSPFSLAANIGAAAESALEPVGFLSSFISNMCYVIAVVLIVGSFMQYKRHRDNPTEVRLSTPVMLLLLGLIIGAIPLLPQYLSNRFGTGN
jgi:hypothetical protein